MLFTINSGLIRDLREARGMSKATLARIAGIDAAALGRWERGATRRAQSYAIENLAECFGLEPQDLSPDYSPPRPPTRRVLYDRRALKNLKSERGMSYPQLARASGIPESTVYYLLNLKSPTVATPEQIRALARALGVDEAALTL